MSGLVVPTAIQVIEAEPEPLVLYISEEGSPAGLVRIDATSTPNTIYVGKAPAGTPENATGWTVKRFTFAPLGIALTKANAFGIYANRASLGYTFYT
jgi:hypothetical protein